MRTQYREEAMERARVIYTAFVAVYSAKKDYETFLILFLSGIVVTPEPGTLLTSRTAFV